MEFLALVLVPLFPADVGLVNLDRTSEAIGGIVPAFPNPHEHEPGGLLSYPQVPV